MNFLAEARPLEGVKIEKTGGSWRSDPGSIVKVFQDGRIAVMDPDDDFSFETNQAELAESMNVWTMDEEEGKRLQKIRAERKAAINSEKERKKETGSNRQTNETI
jgi:hypothetical protein